MALDDYRRKRRFGSTPEPEGGATRAGARPIFVVQLHHASHRHYDFRLQVGDTLKSWAVPKGPSFDPKVKRMAVEVEDHPIEYARFEGQIPHGEYGGGHVARFDTGVWTTDGDAQAQLAKGHLRFELHGERLKGGWHLVRSGNRARKPQWLLFKQDDAWAATIEADDLLDGVSAPPAKDALRARRPGDLVSKPKTTAARADKATKVPAAVTALPYASLLTQAAALPGARKRALPSKVPEPQLAKLSSSPTEGDAWLHELKWDGYRLLVSIRKGKVRLWSRNGVEWTQRVPEVHDALAVLGLPDAVLDGELIAGKGLREDFNLLQQVLSGERQGQLRYVMFDVVHLGGTDLSGVPLLARKDLLASLLKGAPPNLGFSSHGIGKASDSFEAARAAGFEGIISKRCTAPYRAGRSDDWRKSKAQESAEFAVVGYTPAKGSRQGIGALLLATPDPTYGWCYAGRIGSGFSDAQLKALGDQLLGLGAVTPSVHMPDHDTDLRAARWLPEPAFVVEVFTRGTGGRGLLRQASFKALRPDKDVATLGDSDASNLRDKKGSDVPTPRKKAGAKASAARVAPQISSPDKILYPDDGITKRQVALYYAAVMDWLLPEIAGRPLSLVRCPGGLRAPCFFQKHATPGLELVSLLPIRESDGGSEDYLMVSDAASVMELVQFNSLEFHPWGSRAQTLEAADRLVFDLDPDEAVVWRDVVAAARLLRDYLRGTGLQSFVRTSGGKGLHLVVPLSPPAPWAQARAFSQAVAEAARDMDPMRFVATASKQKRRGKIFIDWLRNGRGATSVASFSLRSRPGAPVAMPLRWEELGRVKSGQFYNIHNTVSRLKRLKRHPWEGIDGLEQSQPL